MTRRALLGAMFVDTLGGGLLAPFELIYGPKVVGLTLPAAGAIMSVAALSSIAIGPAAGALADRIGPFRVVALANAVGAAGCAVLLVSGDAWGYGAGAFLLSATNRLFWAAFTPFVAAFTAPEELERWFGRLRGARYLGLALGQAASGLALSVGQVTGLRLIVALDGMSFLVALGLVVIAGAGVRTRPGRSGGENGVGYRTALRDRANLALAGLNVIPTLLSLAPLLALPVYVIDQLRLPTWLPGVVAALATVAIAAGTWFGGAILRGRRRLRNLELAHLIWAAALGLFLLAPLGDVVAYAVLTAGMLLAGFAEAVYAPTADALPAALAPAGLQGRYAAMHQMAWGVTEMLSPLLCGLLLATGRLALWIALAAMALAAALAYRRLAPVVLGRDGVAGAVLCRVVERVRDRVAVQEPDRGPS